MIARRRLLVAAGAVVLGAEAAGLSRPAGAATTRQVRIGVLTDMTGPFKDQVGPGSVLAAHLAAEDFAAEADGLGVEILAADHQNKPDIGSQIARQWVDESGVDAIVDLPNSGVALAVARLLEEKGRVALASSTATSDLTGKACGATTVQWVLDTWSLGQSAARALIAQGATRWYFITVDYALGHALKRDCASAVAALGGGVVGESLHPLGTTDFSSLLLQAQASGAQVVALANTGADMINAVKQAAEFGLTQSGLKFAALFAQISDIGAIGLQTAQGVVLTEAFYWDLNDATRAWSRRFAFRLGGGRMPTEDQAGVYAATLAYLRAVRDAGTQEAGAVIARLKSAPIDDALFGRVTIRQDGRAIHPMYLFRAKTPAASSGAWDLYERLDTIPAEVAFRPLDAGGCKLVKP